MLSNGSMPRFSRAAVATRLRKVLRSREARFYALGLLGGTLQGLAWPPFSLWPLNAVFYVPFLLGLAATRSLKEALWLALGQGMAGSWLGFHWLAYMAESFGGLPAPIAWIVVFLYSLIGQGQHFLFVLAWKGFAKFTKGRALPLLTVPALYVALEYVYPKIFRDTQGAMAHPWLSLIQITEHTGVLGLTFLLLWLNAILAAVVAPLIDPRAKKVFAEGRRAAAIHGAAFAVVVLGLHQWGARRLAQVEEAYRKLPVAVRASVIQANIGDADKLASEMGSGKALRHVLDTYESMSREAAATRRPDLIVWPETSFPYLYTHFSNPMANARGDARDEWLMTLIESMGVPIYFGGYSSDGKREYNSAWLVSNRRDQAWLYQKHLLLAFGETVPLGPLGPPLRDLFPAIGDFGRGPGPTTILFKGRLVGPLICYETLHQGYVIDTVRKGAQWLLNVTNDSWFGPVGEPEDHLLLSLFRSIETRRPLLRATNTGITALIEPTGRVVAPTGLFTKIIYDAEIRLPEPGKEDPAGLYLRWGAAWFPAAAALLAAFLALIRRRR